MLELTCLPPNKKFGAKPGSCRMEVHTSDLCNVAQERDWQTEGAGTEVDEVDGARGHGCDCSPKSQASRSG